jgi:hypothetical protein
MAKRAIVKRHIRRIPNRRTGNQIRSKSACEITLRKRLGEKEFHLSGYCEYDDHNEMLIIHIPIERGRATESVGL